MPPAPPLPDAKKELLCLMPSGMVHHASSFACSASVFSIERWGREKLLYGGLSSTGSNFGKSIYFFMLLGPSPSSCCQCEEAVVDARKLLDPQLSNPVIKKPTNKGNNNSMTNCSQNYRRKLVTISKFFLVQNIN